MRPLGKGEVSKRDRRIPLCISDDDERADEDEEAAGGGVKGSSAAAQSFKNEMESPSARLEAESASSLGFSGMLSTSAAGMKKSGS